MAFMGLRAVAGLACGRVDVLDQFKNIRTLKGRGLQGGGSVRRGHEPASRIYPRSQASWVPNVSAPWAVVVQVCSGWLGRGWTLGGVLV